MFMLPMVSAMGSGGGGRKKKRKAALVESTGPKEPVGNRSRGTGGGRGGGGGTGGSGGGPGPTPGEGHAELEISSIAVSPAQPPAGEDFRASVEVTNVGETASGDYGLETHIVGRKDTVETFSGSRLKPGQKHIFSLEGWVVNRPGKRKMRAKIEPSPGDRTRNSPTDEAFTIRKGKKKRKA